MRKKNHSNRSKTQRIVHKGRLGKGKANGIGHLSGYELNNY
jgi:hypothetical protein